MCAKTNNHKWTPKLSNKRGRCNLLNPQPVARSCSNPPDRSETRLLVLVWVICCDLRVLKVIRRQDRDEITRGSFSEKNRTHSTGVWGKQWVGVRLCLLTGFKTSVSGGSLPLKHLWKHFERKTHPWRALTHTNTHQLAITVDMSSELNTPTRIVIHCVTAGAGLSEQTFKCHAENFFYRARYERAAYLQLWFPSIGQ